MGFIELDALLPRDNVMRKCVSKRIPLTRKSYRYLRVSYYTIKAKLLSIIAGPLTLQSLDHSIPDVIFGRNILEPHCARWVQHSTHVLIKAIYSPSYRTKSCLEMRKVDSYLMKIALSPASGSSGLPYTLQPSQTPSPPTTRHIYYLIQLSHDPCTIVSTWLTLDCRIEDGNLGIFSRDKAVTNPTQLEHESGIY